MQAWPKVHSSDLRVRVRHPPENRLFQHPAKGGLGTVSTAFVASGDTLVDSISVTGLAGYTDAPLLLTPSGSLHGGVRDFIEDYGVGTVYVLGGEAAISDAAVTAIEALTSEPTVTRIAGDDRYATAAEVASMIETESSWCGTDASSAVLINGATEALPFGVAVQTIAYRLQLPVLMTAADELSAATADYIDDNDIEHVQIIGGTDMVSAGVASALTTLGVDTVGRVDGDSAPAVSVELAKLANNGCKDSLGLVSSDRVALVRGNPDGVVAAPVLASSLANDYLVTPLVVGDSLPDSVSDYLAATPKSIGANKLNLGVVAVGGMSAVSEATMDAALSAAASSGALSVAIGANTDTNRDGPINADDPVQPDATDIVTTDGSEAGPTFRLYFSDGVAPDVARLQDIIEINGVPAVVLTAVTSPNTSCDNTKIDVTLGQHLSAGDVIEVVESNATFGIGDDKRTVAPASTTVTAAAPDRAKPTITIVGIAATAVDNADREFHISISDNVGIAGTAQITDAEVRIVGGPGATNPVPTVSVAHDAGAATAVATVSRNLVVGDRLIVSPGAVEDAAGNESAGTSGSAIRAQASPRITSVLMSELKHSAHTTWTVPSTLVGSALVNTAGAITIDAKETGDAAGAAGNGWTMVFDRASTYSTAKPLDIDVRVDTKGQRVTVRFNNGPATATLGDLLAALKANADFDERFSAGFTTCDTAAEGSVRPLNLAPLRNQPAAQVGSGRTQFAVEVNFNAFVSVVRNANLLEDVLAAVRVRTRPSAAEEVSAGNRRVQTAASDEDTADGGLRIVDDLSVESPSLTETVAVGTPPTRRVRYEMETALVRYLPMARDLVETAAGNDAWSAIVGPPAFAEIIGDAGVATGFAADAPAPGTTDVIDTAQDRVDEDLNGSSQRRITVSSSVKTP